MNEQDIANFVLDSLKNSDDAGAVEALEIGIRIVAAAQKRLGVRGVYSTIESGGDVTVSTVFDSVGASAVPYARIENPGGVLRRVGNISLPAKKK